MTWKDLRISRTKEMDMTGEEPMYLGGLVSTGVELTFFLAAGRVLCFRFGMRIMLLISSQGLFNFSHWPAERKVGSAQKAWRRQNQGS